MSKYPPNNYDEPYIGNPLPMGEISAMSDTFGAIDTSLDRIAWLEAQVAWSAARIAELEAQVLELGKGESREWVKSTQLDELQARVVELEAENGTLRAGMSEAGLDRFSEDVNQTLRIAELEAERDDLDETLRVAGIRIAQLEAADDKARTA